MLFADESGTSVNVGQPTKEFTRIYRPSDRVRDFELTAVDLPPNKKYNNNYIILYLFILNTAFVICLFIIYFVGLLWKNSL